MTEFFERVGSPDNANYKELHVMSIVLEFELTSFAPHRCSECNFAHQSSPFPEDKKTAVDSNANSWDGLPTRMECLKRPEEQSLA